MNKKTLFRAALAVMCAIAFSVCLSSCDKNEDDPYQEETSLSLNVDTNGVNFTVTPYLNWGASWSDIDVYMAKNYPDFEACDDGKLMCDTVSKRWYGYYNSDNMYAGFFFNKESGKDLIMTEFCSYAPTDIDRVKDEIVKHGFKYKGLLYFDYLPDYLNYFYLSADETLELQISVYNNQDVFWSLLFQPTDLNDYNHLIDVSTLSINTYSGKDTCTLTPLLDWNATFEDAKEFMAQNCPDWKNNDDEALVLDSIYGSKRWGVGYYKDNLGMFFYYNDAQGKDYRYAQYVCYESSDMTPIFEELTRNGCRYYGKGEVWHKDQESSYVYVSPDNRYIAEISAWNYGNGWWCLNIFPYYKEYLDSLNEN